MYLVFHHRLDNGPFELEAHHKFNKYLPSHIIKQIVSYLNIYDNYHLVVSKLFAPYLLQTQNFFEDMHTLWCHVLTQHIISNSNLYLSSSFTPMILDNRLYVVIDSYQTKFMRYITKTNPDTLESFQRFTDFFDFIFESYNTYKTYKITKKKEQTWDNSWLYDLEEAPLACDKYCTCRPFKFYTNLQNEIKPLKHNWARGFIEAFVQCR